MVEGTSWHTLGLKKPPPAALTLQQRGSIRLRSRERAQGWVGAEMGDFCDPPEQQSGGRSQRRERQSLLCSLELELAVATTGLANC